MNAENPKQTLPIVTFISAATKIEHAISEGGFGHATWCNYQHPDCPRCNCGIADTLTALKQYRQEHNAVVVPLCGPTDGWPRTGDGWLVRPGNVVDVSAMTGQTVRKVYDGGEYGFCVELESVRGSEGWVALRDCRHNPQGEAPSPSKPPCSSCEEVHAILDADESRIIRNAKDGYPDGRELRDLTLAERVKALCIYAADWKRWCIEAEKPNPGDPVSVSPGANACSSSNCSLPDTLASEMAEWLKTPAAKQMISEAMDEYIRRCTTRLEIMESKTSEKMGDAVAELERRRTAMDWMLKELVSLNPDGAEHYRKVAAVGA